MSNEENNICQPLPGEGQGHIHQHHEAHWHGHIHEHICPRDFHGEHTESRRVITIRSHSGLSGDIMLCGLALCAMHIDHIEPGTEEADSWLNKLLESIKPELAGCAKIRIRKVSGIAGWHAFIDLAEEHTHRNIADISDIIEASAMSDAARSMALECFHLLAECEALAHGVETGQVHFHEVGAMDSILDICAVCALFDRLNPEKVVCSPLPVTDGKISCAHGILPAPAPAALRLLKGLPVRPFEGDIQAGELLTPTALTLLRTLPVEFGPWPACKVHCANLVYGTREFRGAPNGATFVLGELSGQQEILY